MRWGTLRSWWVVSGLVVIVAALTAVPAVVKSAHLGGPGWLVPVATVVAGVLLTVWKPILTARSDALTARTRIKAEREMRAASAVQALPTRRGRVPRVEKVTDRAVLNIHEAIPLPAGAGAEGLSADLPEYVTRDVDADLRTFLNARRTSGGFALLVGPAAAGKTRTAYEAVRRELPRWNMVMPATGAELNGLAAGTNLARSVIWLNEAQDFLNGTAPLTAATVRRLLTDTTRPVIIIGTIWPDRYDQLRSTARTNPGMADAADPAGADVQPAGSAEGQPAPAPTAAEPLGRNARDVLEQARTFSLSRFSQEEWDRTAELASRDPRLAEASRHRDSGLAMTQILSAAPELIHRWEQADTPYGQALLTAAVTARRCGHPDTIPAPLLQSLAEQFLTGPQRANAPSTWFDDALTWACQPVHHSTDITPLRPHAEAIGHTDGYRVSDILTNHTTATSPAPRPDSTPTAVWDSLTTTSDLAACVGIGSAAYNAGLIHHATTAWTRAADNGSTDAMNALGLERYEQGDTEGALGQFTRAADIGNTDAAGMRGVILNQQGDLDGACTWLTHAAEDGNTNAMSPLGTLLYDQGDLDGARTWLTRAAANGNVEAASTLAEMEED